MKLFKIKTGLPQGSVLVYLLHTSDISTSNSPLLASSTDDTAIISRGDYCKEAATKTQQTLDSPYENRNIQGTKKISEEELIVLFLVSVPFLSNTH